MTPGRPVLTARNLAAALWIALATLLLGVQLPPPPQSVPVDHAQSVRAYKPTPLVARGQAAEALVRVAGTTAAPSDGRSGDGGRGPAPVAALPPSASTLAGANGRANAPRPTHLSSLRVAGAADRYRARAPPSA